MPTPTDSLPPPKSIVNLNSCTVVPSGGSHTNSTQLAIFGNEISILHILKILQIRIPRFYKLSTEIDKDLVRIEYSIYRKFSMMIKTNVISSVFGSIGFLASSVIPK